MNTKEYNQEIKKLKEGISNLKEENKLLKEQKINSDWEWANIQEEAWRAIHNMGEL